MGWLTINHPIVFVQPTKQKNMYASVEEIRTALGLTDHSEFVLKACNNILNIFDTPEQRAEYILFQRGFGRTTESILEAVFKSQFGTVMWVSSWQGHEKIQKQASAWCEQLGLNPAIILTRGVTRYVITDQKINPTVMYKDSAKIIETGLMTNSSLATKILTLDEIRAGLGLLKPEDQILKAVQFWLDSDFTNWEKAQAIKQMRGFGSTTEVLLNVVYNSQMHKVAIEAFFRPRSEDLAKKARDWAVQLGIDPSNILAAPIKLEAGTTTTDITTYYDRFRNS